MGKYAQSRRRGGGAGAVASALAAPVLSLDGPNAVAWTWSGVDPVQWSIDLQDPVTHDWSTFDIEDGSLRAAVAIDSGNTYSIIGLDAGFLPVTGRSNSVVMP